MIQGNFIQADCIHRLSSLMCPHEIEEKNDAEAENLTVKIYNFGGRDLEETDDFSKNKKFLPGKYLSFKPDITYLDANLSGCDKQCLKAHTNVTNVAQFINDVLQHTSSNGEEVIYISSINCKLNNAGWLKPLSDRPAQTIFGQCNVNGQLRSYAVAQDMVAHEFFHGLNYQTVGFDSLERSGRHGFDYRGESGSLDESYADIFAILFSNYNELNIQQWIWEIGQGFGEEGRPIRDLSNPSKYNQPEHMDHYCYYSPLERAEKHNDWLGVHYNSGIHNKVAYNLLTCKNASGEYIFDARTVAIIFYLALKDLRPTSLFKDSYIAVQQAAKTLFRNDPHMREKLKAISEAFKKVGIDDSSPGILKRIRYAILRAWSRSRGHSRTCE
ncbi:M4 family metallopeptidase [Nostoc sp. NMS8]|uniref:M4 family metallopeptidase n=1 Tax=Nostoc sp. NMS8 TaxID=2815392 RepID=UPI0025CC1382|nr:M4 family metallopeptidase [Nostoc sp. NMS8]MBN3959638.1 M4 family metallopeptidase [Nostoc sp. NMS8]